MGKFMLYFGFTMAVMFVAFGCYFIFSKSMEFLPAVFRNVIGIVFILYGILRCVNMYYKFKDTNDENQ